MLITNAVLRVLIKVNPASSSAFPVFLAVEVAEQLCMLFAAWIIDSYIEKCDLLRLIVTLKGRADGLIIVILPFPP